MNAALPQSTAAAAGAPIDLWFVFMDEVNDPALLERYRGLVTEEEAAQATRFHFERDRRRHLVTRALVRTVLSRYAAVEPADWRFAANAQGKPRLLNELPHGRPLAFNVSHTDGLVMLGVSRGLALGVDVERLAPRESAMAMARRHFSPKEVAALHALPAARQGERFLELWTLKEAYLKARGVGLSGALDGCSFALEAPGRVAMSMAPAAGGRDEGRWDFLQFRVGAGHLGAVCVQADGRAPAWKARKALPLVSQAPLPLQCLRTSAPQGVAVEEMAAVS